MLELLYQLDGFEESNKIHSRKMNMMRGVYLKKIDEKMNSASGTELKEESSKLEVPSLKVFPGQAQPLGGSKVESGTNFAIFSQNATAVTLCLVPQKSCVFSHGLSFPASCRHSAAASRRQIEAQIFYLRFLDIKVDAPDLDPQYGLYTSFVPPLIYAFIGSSRDIAIGPVAVVSLWLGTMLHNEIDPKNKEEYLLPLDQ